MKISNLEKINEYILEKEQDALKAYEFISSNKDKLIALLKRINTIVQKNNFNDFQITLSFCISFCEITLKTQTPEYRSIWIDFEENEILLVTTNDTIENPTDDQIAEGLRWLLL